MDTYAYLLFSSGFLAVWLVLFVLRRDLRSKMLKVSLVGAAISPIAERWYLTDYWRPPTLLGQAVISWEDIIFSFAITGVCAAVYEEVFQKKDRRNPKAAHRRLFFFLFWLTVATLLFFNRVVGINSVIISSLTFLVLALFMSSIRHDLLKPFLWSALIITFLSFLIYSAVFVLLVPGWWDRYWLMSGFQLFGQIPWTELLWYFCFSSLASIDWEFAFGDRLVSLSRHKAGA